MGKLRMTAKLRSDDGMQDQPKWYRHGRDKRPWKFNIAAEPGAAVKISNGEPSDARLRRGSPHFRSD
jgi:hypothetical protein